MKRLISKIIWPAYLAAIVYFSHAGFGAYLHASSIMKDHTVLDAPIELVDTSSRTKRGHTSTTYVFDYTYSVDGREYVAEYSAVNDYGERYLSNPTIRIAYSNTDPAKAGPLHTLTRQSSLWEIMKGVLIAALILFFVALYIYGWALPDDEDEEQQEALETGKQSQTA